MDFVAIDFETANEQRNSACAVGIAVVSGRCLVDSMSWLIQPPILRFNPINVSLHGITERDVAELPRFDELWPDLAKFVDGKTIIAHNASFDLGVLQSVLNLYGIGYPDIKMYCTCTFARRVWPALSDHKLATVARHLGIAFKHHDACEDAVACARIALCCCEKADARDLATLATKFDINPRRLFEGIQPTPARSPRNKRKSQPERQGCQMGGLSEMRVSFTKSGLQRYEIEICHDELNKFQVIRSDDPHFVQQKARSKLAQWDDTWRKREEAEQLRRRNQERATKSEDNKAIAAKRTQEAREELRELENVLAYTLDIDDAIDWGSLKDFTDFSKPRPQQPTPPVKPEHPNFPREPRRSDPKYQPTLGLLDKIITSRREAKMSLANAQFMLDHERWGEEKKRLIDETNAQIRQYNGTVKTQHAVHKKALMTWEGEKQSHLIERDRRNAAIEEKRAKYLSGAPDSILDYCDMVLTNSHYPDCFPQTYDLEYKPENNLLIVDYQLPSPQALPTLKEVKYAQSRNEFTEKHISDSQLNKLYDEVLYQIAIRTIHELFEADKGAAIAMIVFNGIVRAINRGTGQQTSGCVMSIQVNKEEFEQLNLAHVDPKACFKKLKGVGSSKLHSITPVPPIMTIDREDQRFVEAYAVADSIKESDNLALMDWEDFEHLIRELFEKHFAAGGGEVKVTRASRDGGVDAIAFDPDPIRGGKIVIQAKRYANTVGVAAVRDLYGTVVNEGANKGILVTTANYGPDAYEFARGKPLTLLDGSNLLHLLQSHGYSARIDLKEAKSVNKRA